MTVSRCASAVSDATTSDSDSKVSGTLTDAASEDDVDDEQSDTESNVEVEEVDDEDIKGRFSRRRVSGIRELTEDDQRALWVSTPRHTNTFTGTRLSPAPRCQSAQGVRRPPHVAPPPCHVAAPRCQSAQGVRRPPHASATVSSFRRSLRLLGFDPGDFGVAQEDAVSRPERRGGVNTTARLKTRVLKRSVSLDSLRQNDVTKAKESLERLDRATLSTAVYEEWYFKKQREARLKRETELHEEWSRQAELEQTRVDKQRKCDEKFSQWLADLKFKTRKNTEKKAAAARSLAQPMLGEQASKEKIEHAYQMWKREKEKKTKLMNQAKQAEMQAKVDKERAKREKRVEANKVFEIWKKRSDELMKRQEQKKEKNTKEVGTKRREKKGPPFEEWKRQKDSERKENARRVMLAQHEEDSARKSRQSDRLYEAGQAFEEWLDAVEERLRAAPGPRRGSQGAAPPWSPGGPLP